MFLLFLYIFVFSCVTVYSLIMPFLSNSTCLNLYLYSWYYVCSDAPTCLSKFLISENLLGNKTISDFWFQGIQYQHLGGNTFSSVLPWFTRLILLPLIMKNGICWLWILKCRVVSAVNSQSLHAYPEEETEETKYLFKYMQTALVSTKIL